MTSKKEMKKIFKKLVYLLLALICALHLVSCSGSEPQSVSCPYPLRQLTMLDKQTGWGLSLENEVLFTTDGIEHFKTLKSYETASFDRFVSAAFLDSRTAYTALFSLSDNQLIVDRTSDSGASWQQAQIDFADYSDFCDAGSLFLGFSDKQHGYLLCCSTPAAGLMTKLLFSTDDGGASFSFTADLSGTIAGYPQGITAVSEDNLYIAVTYHGIDSYLYQSSDRAKTWTSVDIFPRTADVNYVDGYAPVFDRTHTDDNENGIILLKIVGEQTAFQLFTTLDGGGHWAPGIEIPCENLLSYSIAGDGQLYIIDASGQVLCL